MGLFKMFKHNSKLALKGAWGTAILILLILFGVEFMTSLLRQAATFVFVVDEPQEALGIESIGDALYVFNNMFMLSPIECAIIAVTSVINILLSVPLLYGIARWFFNLVHGRKLALTEVFCFYESGKAYGKAIFYYIGVYVRVLLWAIPYFIVPSAILGASIYFLSAGEDIPRATTAISSAGIFLAAVLYILAGIFYAACINRYALGAYLLGESEDITAGQAIKQSIVYTKGCRFSLLWFELSFFGWLVLSIIALPVMLYVAPYYNTSFAMYARYIIEKNRYEQPNETREFKASDKAVSAETPADLAEDLTEDAPEESADDAAES